MIGEVLIARRVAVGEREAVRLVVARGSRHVEAIGVQIAEAAEHAELGRAGAAAAIDRAAVAAVELQALEVVLRDDVDHAGDSVRAVLRHGAGLHDFDAVDGVQRQRVQVEERVDAVREERERRNALSIHQHQRVFFAEAAQGDTRSACGEVAETGLRSSYWPSWPKCRAESRRRSLHRYPECLSA